MYNFKTISLLFILAYSLFSFNCNEAPDSSSKKFDYPDTGIAILQTQKVFTDSYPTGKIIDSLICRSDKSRSYALFLPHSYSPDKKWPVIYFLDPHAKGSYPLKKYRGLAEKYQYILVGSNAIKNGIPFEAIEKYAIDLFKDVEDRCSIDPARIYVGGFSGGTRVASYLSNRFDFISGMVGCGAGPPDILNVHRDNFCLAVIVGNEDLNYMEVYKLAILAKKYPLPFQLIRFNGKHEWPPTEVFEEGFLWLEINAMKKGQKPIHDSLIAAIHKRYDKLIQSCSKEKDIILLNEIYSRYLNLTDGFSNMDQLKGKIAQIESSNGFKTASARQETDFTNELRIQNQYLQNIVSHDLNWWRNEVKIFKQQSGSKGLSNLQERRLMNYLSLACYSYSNSALAKNDLQSAEYFIALYHLVDPDNPEPAYLFATLSMKRGKKEMALTGLKDAIHSGFDDLNRMNNDSTFKPIRDSPTYRIIVRYIREKLEKERRM